MRNRRLVLAAGAVFMMMTLAAFIRIRYEKLGWGGYWYIDVVAPWQR